MYNLDYKRKDFCMFLSFPYKTVFLKFIYTQIKTCPPPWRLKRISQKFGPDTRCFHFSPFVTRNIPFWFFPFGPVNDLPFARSLISWLDILRQGCWPYASFVLLCYVLHIHCLLPRATLMDQLTFEAILLNARSFGIFMFELNCKGGTTPSS